MSLQVVEAAFIYEELKIITDTVIEEITQMNGTEGIGDYRQRSMVKIVSQVKADGLGKDRLLKNK